MKKSRKSHDPMFINILFMQQCYVELYINPGNHACFWRQKWPTPGVMWLLYTCTLIQWEKNKHIFSETIEPRDGPRGRAVKSAVS